MSSSDLSTVLRPARTADFQFRAEIPDGWQQGRGAFGGVVLGVLASAMEESRSDASWLARSLNGEIVGPVLVGAAEISVEVLRKGTGIETLSARLTQNGELLARASMAFGKNRVMDRERRDLKVPTPPPWQDIGLAPIEPPMGPQFAQFFEFRITDGMPFVSGPRAFAEGFIRPKLASRGLQIPEVVACCDAWFPAAYACEELPRPMATLSSTLQFCGPLEGIDFSTPLFHRSIEAVSHQGFSVEFRELWSGNQLLALNQQTFVFVK